MAAHDQAISWHETAATANGAYQAKKTREKPQTGAIEISVNHHGGAESSGGENGYQSAYRRRRRRRRSNDAGAIS